MGCRRLTGVQGPTAAKPSRRSAAAEGGRRQHGWVQREGFSGGRLVSGSDWIAAVAHCDGHGAQVACRVGLRYAMQQCRQGTGWAGAAANLRCELSMSRRSRSFSRDSSSFSFFSFARNSRTSATPQRRACNATTASVRRPAWSPSVSLRVVSSCACAACSDAVDSVVDRRIA